MKHWMLAISLTIMVNILFLGMIPLLSQNGKNVQNKNTLEPILLTCYQPPPLTDSPVQRHKLPSKPERIMKQIPLPSLSRTHRRKMTPQIALHMPSFRFDINSRLQTGANVSPIVQEPNFSTSLFSKEFGLGEVDQVPQIIRRIKPIYPYVARMRSITGRVVVKFLVDPHGHVRKPSILEAHPRGVFENSALNAVRKWYFRPGYWEGHPVATWVVVPIHFKLSS